LRRTLTDFGSLFLAFAIIALTENSSVAMRRNCVAKEDRDRIYYKNLEAVTGRQLVR
jgi:hypothetical protein